MTFRFNTCLPTLRFPSLPRPISFSLPNCNTGSYPSTPSTPSYPSTPSTPTTPTTPTTPSYPSTPSNPYPSTGGGYGIGLNCSIGGSISGSLNCNYNVGGYGLNCSIGGSISGGISCGIGIGAGYGQSGSLINGYL